MKHSRDTCSSQHLDRRSLLRVSLAGAAALALGKSAPGQPGPAVPSTRSEPGAGSRIPAVDTHIHLVRGNPDLKPIGDYGTRMTDIPVRQKAENLKREMAQGNIRVVLAMGHRNGAKEDPLGINSTLEVAALVPALRVIGIIDPTRTSRAHLQTVERQIKRERKRLVALKAYLGYLRFGPEDPRYRPYYQLAEKYRLPIVFHTGDTWSFKAHVKYAHPLRVDEVAADHPGVQFVLAHFGNPWFRDAAEVVGKNDNVWADLSGLYVGDEQSLDAVAKQGSFPEVIPGLIISDLVQAIAFTGRYDRFLYASDWPFLPMATYRRFVELLIPHEHHPKVFRENKDGASR